MLLIINNIYMDVLCKIVKQKEKYQKISHTLSIPTVETVRSHFMMPTQN